MTPIDLNADLGEGFGRWRLTDDADLLSVVTSANVACGFHAGDAATMRRVCELAAERGVRIGAQVSYRDLAGFGRRAMDVPPDELAAEVAYQIGALEVFARAAGACVVRETARRALQPRRARRGAGGGGRRGCAARGRRAARPRSPSSSRIEAGRAGRTAHRHGGVRGPRLHRAGHAGAPHPGRRGDHGRPEAVVERSLGPARFWHGHVALRGAYPGPGPLVVPARRHPGRGGPGTSGPARVWSPRASP